MEIYQAFEAIACKGLKYSTGPEKANGDRFGISFPAEVFIFQFYYGATQGINTGVRMVLTDTNRQGINT